MEEADGRMRAEQSRAEDRGVGFPAEVQNVQIPAAPGGVEESQRGAKCGARTRTRRFSAHAADLRRLSVQSVHHKQTKTPPRSVRSPGTFTCG